MSTRRRSKRRWRCKVRIALIAALGTNGVIGKKGGHFGLPWDLPDDRRYFREQTTGKVIVEGRTTYEAAGRLWPNRTTIILSRDPEFAVEGALIAHSVEHTIALGEVACAERGTDELMVVGGTQIFAQFLPRADRLYLTEVNAQVDGDAFFPEFDKNKWREASRSHHPADERHAYAFDFVIYDRT